MGFSAMKGYYFVFGVAGLMPRYEPAMSTLPPSVHGCSPRYGYKEAEQRGVSQCLPLFPKQRGVGIGIQSLEKGRLITLTTVQLFSSAATGLQTLAAMCFTLVTTVTSAAACFPPLTLFVNQTCKTLCSGHQH